MHERELEDLYERFRRDGDAVALAALFDACAPELFGLARRLTRDASDAEDAVQSTFVTLIQSARDFDASRKFLPWALGVVAMHARTLRRRAARAASARDPDAIGTVAREARRDAETSELEVALQEALEELPAVYRDVLVPYLSRAATPSEIAESLRISPNAARVRLHRGLRILRRALPSGFAGAGAVVLLEGQRFGRVRAEILEAARRSRPRGGFRPRAKLATASRWLGAAAVLLAIPIVGAWMLRDGAERAGEALAAGARATAATPALADAAERDTRRVDGAADMRWTLRGRVVASDTGEPLEGARAWVTPAGASERELRATSAADGVLELRLDPAEEPSLYIERADRAPLRVPLTPERRAAFFERCGRSADESLRRVAYRELPLARGVAIRARVEREDDRAPIAGAPLLLFHTDAEDRLVPATEHVVGTSDAGGDVRFDGLLPLPDDARWRGQVLLSPTDAGIAWARFPLARRAATRELVVLVLAPAQSIDVEVRDAGGRSVAGASVAFWPLTSPFQQTWEQLGLDLFLPPPPLLAAEIVRTTGADGVASFPRFLCSRVSQESWYPSSWFRGSLRVDAGADGSYAAMREGPRGEPRRLVVDLAAPHAGARALSRTLRGRTCDEHGAPIAGARVEVEWSDARAATDASGRFELLVESHGGPYEVVRASAEGFAPLRFAHSLDDDAALADEIDVVLSKPRAVRGTVVDEASRPIAGARVSLRPTAGTFEAEIREVAAGADGSFVLEDAGRHRYWSACALPPAGDDVWEEPEANAAIDAAGAPATLVLKRIAVGRGELVVEVVDAETQLPLEPSGAWIAAAPGRRAQVDADPVLELGRVTFASVPAGECDVLVHCLGEGTGWARCRVDRGAAASRARIEVGRLARIVGRVSRAGRPPEGQVVLRASIRVGNLVAAEPHWNDHGRIGATVTAEPDGTFVVDGLVPGTWRLGARSPGAWFDAADVAVRAGEEARVEIALEPAGALELARSGPARQGTAIFEVEHDGAWKTLSEPYLFASNTTTTFAMPVGRVHWRLSFRETDASFRLMTEVPLVLAEGTDAIVAGESATRVPIPARLDGRRRVRRRWA